MTDYTSEILDLVEARGKLRIAKKVIADTVRAEYEVKILREIQDRTAESEAAFARKLKMANAAGLPGGIIRKHVLKTNDWETWKYWRDLAEIEPERVSVANAKEAKKRENASFVWDVEAGMLTTQKNSLGIALVPPVVYDISTLMFRHNLYMMTATDEDYEDKVMRADAPYAFWKFVSAEIKRAIDNGEIDGP